MKKNRIYHAGVIVMAVIMLLPLSGCDEKESFPSYYVDQLLLYIDEDPDGSEIFSTDVYSPNPFSIDESGIKYFYRIDSTKRNNVTLNMVFPDSAIDIPPYTDVKYAVVPVLDAYWGSLNRIELDGDTNFCARMTSLITRKALFLKLYSDTYQYHGWRFWGYWSESSAPNATRTLTGPTLSGTKTLNIGGGNLSGAVLPVQVRAYFYYDTLPVFRAGQTMEYYSNAPDIISVRVSQDSINAFRAESAGMGYAIGWKSHSSGEPFNKLLLVEEPWYFDVDTIDYDIPIVESTLVKFDDYVVFYKAQ